MRIVSFLLVFLFASICRAGVWGELSVEYDINGMPNYKQSYTECLNLAPSDNSLYQGFLHPLAGTRADGVSYDFTNFPRHFWLSQPGDTGGIYEYWQQAKPVEGLGPDCKLIPVEWEFHWYGDTSGLSMWFEPYWLASNGYPNVDAGQAAQLFAWWGGPFGDFTGDLQTDAADAGYLFERWTGDPAPQALPEASGVGLYSVAMFWKILKKIRK